MTRSARESRAVFHTILICGLVSSLRCAPEKGGADHDSAAQAESVVVIYCSADEAFAKPILSDFAKQSGLTIRPVFDAEAGKTTGLLERLRAERSRPVADVWWSSEIFGTVNLFSQGVLTPYAPRSAEGIPAAFRDGRGGWTAFGLRGRVVAFDPKRIARERVPTRWADYAAADIAHRTAIADPRFGTTRGHMAAMSVLWGDEAFQTWLSALADGSPHIAAGNAQTVSMVVRGQVDFGWTDTDDVLVAIRRGDSIDMIHPDLDSPGGEALPGTLWIPNSVGLVAGGPNPVGGRKLIEFIASADMERMLAASDSGNVPVRASIRNAAVPPPKSTRVDYSRVAQALRRTDELCREVLLK